MSNRFRNTFSPQTISYSSFFQTLKNFTLSLTIHNTFLTKIYNTIAFKLSYTTLLFITSFLIDQILLKYNQSFN